MWTIHFRIDDQDDTMIRPIIWKRKEFGNSKKGRDAAMKYLKEKGYKELPRAKTYERFYKLYCDEDDNYTEIFAHLSDD